jgi:hypothetical protein
MSTLLNHTSPLTHQPDQTRRFGKEAVAYELQAITYPGSGTPNATEEARLVKEGWVDELPAFKKIHYKARPDSFAFGKHEIVEQTYVPIEGADPVNRFSHEIGKYIPEGSYVEGPLDYFTNALIRADKHQPSTHKTFTTHPLLGAAMLQTHPDLGRMEYTQLPVNEALKKEFPNLVKLFTEVTDPDRCRTILGDARKIMHQMVPISEKGLFYPVLDLIQRSIK